MKDEVPTGADDAPNLRLTLRPRLIVGLAIALVVIAGVMAIRGFMLRGMESKLRAAILELEPWQLKLNDMDETFIIDSDLEELAESIHVALYVAEEGESASAHSHTIRLSSTTDVGMSLRIVPSAPESCHLEFSERGLSYYVRLTDDRLFRLLVARMPWTKEEMEAAGWPDYVRDEFAPGKW